MATVAGARVKPLRVVVTGSECTGKTTLAAELAQRFAAPWSDESARRAVAALGRALVFEDVADVGRGQVRGEDEAIARATDLVVHDTDLLSTRVYSRYYFGAVPPEVEQLWAQRGPGDLYLLLHPDVPWVPEPGMRGEPHGREELHDLFAAALRDAGADVIDVRGGWEVRAAIAEGAVRRRLARG